MTEQKTENGATCGEAFYTHHSGWSVPRFCHRPLGHTGDCCGPGYKMEHLRRCTDAVTPPAEPVDDTCWCDGPDCGQTPCVEAR